jgi:HK97 family phage prohead protease
MSKPAIVPMISIARFHALAATTASAPRGTCVRLALVSEPNVAATERVASFVFSDNSVDSYGDTIDARGWDLSSFENNPVALYGHDPSQPENVIGKARNVRVQGARLIGDIVFAEAAINPKAELVYQMVLGGFLNAVSVGFEPVEWSLSKDKGRPGGIDFTKQKLREISIVAIPANENALVMAKAAGIDVDRLGLSAPVVTRDLKVTKKGLYSVSSLAALLSELGWLQDTVAWEAEYEGDGSEIPARLLEAMQSLGQILVDMTIEEVGELLGVEGDIELVPAETIALSAPSEAQKSFFALARAAHLAKAPAPPTAGPDIDAAAAEVEAVAFRRRKARVLQLQHELAG